MIDVSTLVQYEREYPLQIKHPATGRPLGITFFVRHIDCDAANEMVKRQAAAKVLASEGEDPPGSDHRDIYAACIARWDWGGNSYKGKVNPELSLEAACMVMRDQQCAWMLRQVMEAVQKIGNFTDT